MVLGRDTLDWFPLVVTEFLFQVREVKYFEVLFKSNGRMEPDIKRWISAASAVMWCRRS